MIIFESNALKRACIKNISSDFLIHTSLKYKTQKIYNHKSLNTISDRKMLKRPIKRVTVPKVVHQNWIQHHERLDAHRILPFNFLGFIFFLFFYFFLLRTATLLDVDLKARRSRTPEFFSRIVFLFL